MNSIISARNLSKWYGEVIGLNSFELQISPGITGIVGPNGAGKTTFFKLVMGLLKPSKGRISVFGERSWKNPQLHAKMGFCPDYDDLPNDVTGRDFLRLIGALYGIDRNHVDKRITEVARIVGMENALRRNIGGYSKGMRQRVKVAASMLHDPELLILDEPLAGTDPLVRGDLIALIKSLHEEHGHHIMVSSHILQEIERITQEVALIYKGRAVAFGNISEIRDLIDKHPHHILITGDRVRTLAKRLLDQPYTVSVTLMEEGEGCIVEVREPNAFFEFLPSLVTELACNINEMYSLDAGLEAVFEYLVEGK